MRHIKRILRSNPYLTRLGRRVQLKFFARYLEPEIRLLPFLVDRTRAAIDVGANVGIYTSALLDLAAKVIAVEANPDLADALRRTFGDRITLLHAAASSEDGQVDLRIPDLGALSTGLATIADENVLEGSSYRTVPVAARRIASLVSEDEPVGFIKIDVEGHELAVLQGALPIIARYRPVILVEAEERHRAGAVASIVDLLATYGYKGFMLHRGVLAAIARFDIDVHQRLSPDQAQHLNAGIRPADYVNNFVFVSDSDPLGEQEVVALSEQ